LQDVFIPLELYCTHEKSFSKIHDRCSLMKIFNI